LKKSHPIEVGHDGRGYKISFSLEVSLFRRGVLTFKKMRSSQVIDTPIRTTGATGCCCN
jgi:hypothetical protein